MNGVETDLPQFIKSRAPAKPEFTFATSDRAHKGEYTIRCYGSLIRRGKAVDTISTDFVLKVEVEEISVETRVGPN